MTNRQILSLASRIIIFLTLLIQSKREQSLDIKMRISPSLLVIGSSAEIPDSSKIEEAIDLKCFQIGEEQPYAMVHNELEGCAQVYDTIKTANRACSLFEQCLLIGKNSNGNFELFTESDKDTAINLESYDLSIPTLDKTQTSLIYGESHRIQINHMFDKILRLRNSPESRKYGHYSNNSL